MTFPRTAINNDLHLNGSFGLRKVCYTRGLSVQLCLLLLLVLVVVGLFSFIFIKDEFIDYLPLFLSHFLSRIKQNNHSGAVGNTRCFWLIIYILIIIIIIIVIVSVLPVICK